MARFSPQVDRFGFIDLLERRASFRDRLEFLYCFDRRRDPAAPEEQRPPRPAPEGKRGAWRERARRLVAEQGPRADPRRLAGLWARAGERESAVESALRAAQSAERDEDPAAAVACFALALGQLPASDARVPALRRRRAEAEAAAGRFHAAARAFAEAAAIAGSREERIRLACLRAEALCEAGAFEAAAAVAAEALESVGRAGDRELRARARRAAALAAGRDGNLEVALDHADAARSACRPDDPAALRVDVLATCGLLRLRLGDDAARGDLEQALAIAGDTALAARALPALAGLTLLEARRAEWKRADARLRELRETATACGRWRLIETVLSRRSTAALSHDRMAIAMESDRQALQVSRQLGDPDMVLAAQCRLADTLRRSGRSPRAVALLRESLRDRLDETSPALTDFTRVLLAGALLDEEPAQRGTARMLVEQALPGLRRQPEELRALALVTDLEQDAAAGGSAPRRPAAAELRLILERADPDPELRVRAELVESARALARGDAAEARSAAERAAGTAAAHTSELLRAAALAGLARSLGALGESTAAAEAARRAREALARGCAAAGNAELEEGVRGRPELRTPEPEAAVAAGADRRLTALYGMIRALNSESDPEALLESILDMAMRAVGAERGMILLRAAQGDAFAVRLSRNLDERTERDAEGFSRSIIREAGGGKSLLAVDARDDRRFRDLESVSLYGIRSLICVPLRVGGTITGTVYLDNRSRRAAFSQADLRFLEAFAEHAAIALHNARRREELERENRALESAAQSRVRFAGLVGRSAPMRQVFELIEKFAASDLPVLILGESGTGKELVARAIQQNGARRGRVFLSENCASLPDPLLESELFGHVKGAFTGADRDHQGLFEQADGGTLFLDEVGDMPAAMQAKLLRVLQEGELRPVGSAATVRVDVRVLAATHRDLAARVAAGAFREDLFYRLSVLRVELPPLRERPDDVRLLVAHFLDRIARERGRAASRLDGEVLELLERHRWPGNVRQLENTLQRMALLAGDRPMTPQLVRADPGLRRLLLPDAGDAPTALSLAASERERIEAALRASAGNRDRAAELLGISRATIYRKIKRHGLG